MKNKKLLGIIIAMLLFVLAIPITAFAGGAEQVTVTFMNGTAQFGDKQVINPGETATKPEEDPKEIWGDSPFLNWCTQYGDVWDFSTAVNENLTLYACYDYEDAIFGYSVDKEGNKVYGLFYGWDGCPKDSDEKNTRLPLAYMPIENDGTWSVDQPSKEGELPVLHIKEGFKFYGDKTGLYILADVVIDFGDNAFDFSDKLIQYLIPSKYEPEAYLTLKGTNTISLQYCTMSTYGPKNVNLAIDGGLHIDMANRISIEQSSGKFFVKDGSIKCVNATVYPIAATNLESFLDNPAYTVKCSTKANPSEADWTTENITVKDNRMFYVGEDKALSVMIATNVAEVGGNYYPTVQAAVDAATEGQTVKLLSDVYLTSTIEIASGKNFKLDMNGKTLDGKNIPAPVIDGDKASVIYINSKATLTLDDSSEGTPGKITGGKGTAQSAGRTFGGGIYNLGVLNMYKISITGNTADCGAGVLCFVATINMYSGKISNNTANMKGGGVEFSSATLNMYGGEISNNTAINGSAIGSGGGVTGSGNLTVSGASKIKGNTFGAEGSKITSNYELFMGSLTIGEDGLTNGAEIGVTLNKGTGAFTTNGTADDAQYFFSDNQTYKVKFVKGDTSKPETDPLYNDHFELANYDLNAIASDTASISLEKDNMTPEQAIAIAKAQMPYDKLQKGTVIAYAKADNFATSSMYKILFAFTESDWSEGFAFTLAGLKDIATTWDVYVIGTTHAHSFTYEADTSNKTITATCSESGCELTESKVVATLVAENKEYTKAAYVGASISGKDAWDSEGADALSLKYKGRGDTSYDESATAPTNIGKYTVTMTASGKSVSADFEITKKQLTVSGTTVESSKTYDGTTTATVTAKGTLAGNISGDDVSLDTVTATYADKNAGTGKTVTVAYTIKGADKDNYLAPVNNTSLKADITKKSIAGAEVTLKGDVLVETGKEQIQKVESVTMDGWKLDITYDVTENKATKAGTYKLKVTGNGNYEGTVEVPFVILEAPKPEEEITPISEKITVKPCGEEGGEVTIEVKQDKDAPKTAINMRANDLLAATASADELRKVAQGENLSIWVEVEKSNEAPSKDAQKAIEKLLAGRKIGYYMDITIYKQVEGEKATQITDTNEGTAIVISTEVAEDVRQKNEKFGIIRYHEVEEKGVANVLDATYDAKSAMISFKSGEFSVYALTMEAIPGTGDHSNLWLYIVIAVAAMGAIAGMAVTLRMRAKR